MEKVRRSARGKSTCWGRNCRVTRVAWRALCRCRQGLVLAVPPLHHHLIVLQVQSPACPLLGGSVLLCSSSQRVCPPLPHCRIWELQPSGPQVPGIYRHRGDYITVVLSPHKVLESRGCSLQRLQILHRSTRAAVALADIPSHGFASQHSLWHPGPALSPPLSWQKGPAQPPVGLRDPTPSPPSRQENGV